MAVNKHFHSPGLAAATANQPRAWQWRSHLQVEKSLYADLVAEAIHHRGHSVFYLDRTLVAEDNVFGEDHAHGVRNLVINPDFLSQISN